MARRLSRLFVRGLTVVLPLALTAYAAWWLVSSVERLFRWLWRLVLPDAWYYTGFGIVLGVAAIMLVGTVAGGWLGRALFGAVEELLLRIPVVKTVFASVRDFISFVGGKKAGGMGRVVVAEVSPGVRMVGFVTKEDAARLTGLADDRGNAAVYVPMAYNLGGYLLFVPRERLTPLDMKVEEALRLAITAGVTEDEVAEPLPKKKK